MRRQRLHRRGGNAIELALTMPIWITVIAASLDFGWLAHQQTSLDTAVNIGCRAGSVLDPGENDEDLDALYASAEASMRSMIQDLNGDCSICTFEFTAIGAFPERTLQCSVSQPVDGLVGVVLYDYTLSADHVARMEWQYDEAL